jgi:hypothetical protein
MQLAQSDTMGKSASVMQGSNPATCQYILSFIIGFRGPQSLALAAAFFKDILCNKL